MNELLLELFSEEIPARMQKIAAEKLQDELIANINKEGLIFAKAQNYFSPRRLSIIISGISDYTEQKTIELKGPAVNAPPQSVDGFLKSADITRDKLVQKEIKGNLYFFAYKEIEAVAAKYLLAKIIQEVLEKFVWPKSMRWGNVKIRWVRPLHNILCIFNKEILPLEFGHLIANNKTYGHHFLTNTKEVIINSVAEYKDKLRENFVLFDQKERKQIIQEQLNKIAAQYSLKIRHDEGLLDEVTGLVEWPECLIGNIQHKFMQLPAEVLITSIRTHQKYFCLYDQNNKLAPYFIVVANSNVNKDIIVSGNEKVLNARLSDASFFWEYDLRKPLISYNERLNNVIFHEKLGTVHEKVLRLQQLAEFISHYIIDSDITVISRAALLCKADLVTDMVGEFPELQGIIGKYYALQNKEDDKVAYAIADHYKPISQEDSCASEPNSIIIAIAEKIDNIVGLWSVGEKPTGSKDPYALRRAAIGVINTILSNKIRISLDKLIRYSVEIYFKQRKIQIQEETIDEIKRFFYERLKSLLKDKDISHDIIHAVIKNIDDIYIQVEKLESINQLIKSEEGKDLIIAYKRASNIVGSEEKKDNKAYNEEPNKELFTSQYEENLFSQIRLVQQDIEKFLEEENFLLAMKQLKRLQVPIKEFFDNIIVNDDKEQLRINRLRILSTIRNFLNDIADFSLIEL
jgi:glycyl-tRNA synthetase beta chain